MEPQVGHLAYRAGECARCGAALRESEPRKEVALHIIAVVAAYGLPLSAPLLVPYVRRHHPSALPGLHAAQHRLNNVVKGPFTVLVLAFGIYLATDGHRWGEPFVAIGIRRPGTSDSPEANVVTSWPRRTSSTTSS